MQKYFAISLIFVTGLYYVRSENYYEGPSDSYDSPPDNKLEELFLRQFLDEIKPFISPIVEEWKRHGFPDNMPGDFFQHLVEKYAQSSTSLSPTIIESFLRLVEEFKTCVDQTLARAADDPALRDIQSMFPDIGDDGKTYSQKEKLSMFRALGDNKHKYSKRFGLSGTTEAIPAADMTTNKIYK